MLRHPGWLERLSERGVPTVWIQSLRVLLGVVDDLERQLAAIDKELRPIARNDRRVRLLATIPGVGELLGLTIAAEIGEIAGSPAHAS
jgi:transposase